jgi:hypothetical protein
MPENDEYINGINTNAIGKLKVMSNEELAKGVTAFANDLESTGRPIEFVLALTLREAADRIRKIGD